MKNVLVITGPTATGKTTVGIELANKLKGEIVSCDSRQIYKLMDIGTAKPTKEEQSQAVHHLIDIVYPDEKFSAGLYEKKATEMINDIFNRRKLPIIIGGSGLYLKALTRGLFQGPPADEKLREKLRKEKEQLGLENLYRKLKKVDPKTCQKISPTDEVRILRGLEVYQLTGKPISEWQEKGQYSDKNLNFIKFGLNLERKRLYQRINQRVDKMMEAGFLKEVENLIAQNYSFQLPALRTFGYLDMYAYLEGKISLEEALDKFKQGTRNYAKRQLTWFRKEAKISWLDIEEENPVDGILNRFQRVN
ncbi:MAG: tRNA (adenosine(37)-N6)-dimethylallyltransferase MiaA [candidate division Zixibacteria bacterium RBG_16_40_9]|nr:MAG: tRNA (adenosine(37)-N6)-dimethylallyltransferase MiaA [candidate division Zixibacteria bacterium RBG_16_40_9]